MWMTENRNRYDRSKLRYLSDLTDEEWQLDPAMLSHGHCGDVPTKPSLKKPTSNKNYNCNAKAAFSTTPGISSKAPMARNHAAMSENIPHPASPISRMEQ
jgi:hypothetical protein